MSAPLQSEYTRPRLADSQQVEVAPDGVYKTEAERRLAENQAALRGSERSRGARSELVLPRHALALVRAV
jgi:hypothetical protein